MQEVLSQIETWLQQPIATYWLVGGLTMVLLGWLINALVNRKKTRELADQYHTLDTLRATNQQRIEQLELDRTTLSEQEQQNRAQIQVLVAERAQLKTSRDEKVAQLTHLEHEKLGLREMIENHQRKLSRLEVDIRERETQLSAERDKLNELKAQFEQQKGELKNEFKLVSEEVIKERQRMLTEQNREGMGALLKPLQQQLQGFQQRINEVHTESVKGHSTLKSEIENVMKMGIQMREEASNLTTALKGDSQQRGAWGEAQLERTLELSGLIAGDHYEKQSSFTDDGGSRKHTDFLIKLPQNKCIIIDSKVSLNAYERACASTPEHHAVAMKAHVNAVRKHIQELASKEYANLEGLHSPDFVLMFMPVEPAYIEAMKHDPELFAFGYNQNVILVSHTTLMPILRTVANLWMLDKSNKEARLLGNKANDLYNSVVTVSERLESLGKTLGTASKHYNSVVTALAGNQGLQGKVKRFSELSSKANKTMPTLEHNHPEFDTRRLEIEPLPAQLDEVTKDNKSKQK